MPTGIKDGHKHLLVCFLILITRIEFFIGTSPPAASSLKRLPIYTSRTVAGTIKKFDKTQEPISTPKTPSSRSLERTPYNNLENTNLSKRNTKTDTRHTSRVDKILEKFSKKEPDTIPVPVSQIRYRSPSPSLLRKTQAVLAKEKCNEIYMTKNVPKSPVASHKMSSVYNKTNKVPCPNSPVVNRREKPKSENFQKAVAFWNLT